MKIKKEHVVYTAVMTAMFITLDVLGVSHGDKIALSTLVGVVGPLCVPRLAEKLALTNASE